MHQLFVAAGGVLRC